MRQKINGDNTEIEVEERQEVVNTGALQSDTFSKKAPWELALLALIPFIALYLSEDGSPVLPVLGAVLLISYIIPFRLQDIPPQNHIVRVLIFSIVIVMNMMRPNSDVVNMFDIRTMRWVGELAATELTLRFWLIPLTKDRIGGGLVFSGIILMAACSTLDERFIPFLAPIYILLLLFSLRLIRPGIVELLSTRSIKTYSFIAFAALALALGGTHYIILHNYRNELSSLTMKFLNDRANRDAGQLDLNPSLGSRFGEQGSPNRALRIEGSGDFAHLRASTYESYVNGSWRPDPMRRMLTQLLASDMDKAKAGQALSVTRFSDNNGLIFLPLNASFVSLPNDSEMDWSPAAAGPVRADPSASTIYNCTISDDAEAQGFLTRPPSPESRIRLLDIPPEINPKVKTLAYAIVGKLTTATEKVEAIQHYLLTNHKYSLKVIIPGGDPVSVFLLDKKSAHCEYFGSAMTILARCVGVPARYVVGYYAHETEKQGITVVRQRDAHAWSECWIENKGWVTVDATPGDGRPDQRYGSVPTLQQWGERWQDFVLELKIWLQKTNKMKLTLSIAAIIVVSTVVFLLLSYRRKPKLKAANFTYSSPEEALVKLYSRFETLTRKQNVLCPPYETWMDCLKDYDEAAIMKSGLSRDSLIEFVQAYNSARFGGANDRQIQKLADNLDSIANSIVNKGTQ